VSAGFRLELECGHTYKRQRYGQHVRCPKCDNAFRRIVKVYKGGIEIPYAVPVKVRQLKERAAAFRALHEYEGADPTLDARVTSVTNRVTCTNA
jgi:DNA-directed RNA polymerase subunit RPC12/RpoP